MEYVNDGLRTLMLAKTEVPLDKYKAWAARYHEAETAQVDREARR